MYKTCAKHVDNLRVRIRTTCARLSPFGYTKTRYRALRRVQPVVIRAFMHKYAQLISTANLSTLPLFEHYLYPLSTPPTITTTK